MHSNFLKAGLNREELQILQLSEQVRNERVSRIFGMCCLTALFTVLLYVVSVSAGSVSLQLNRIPSFVQWLLMLMSGFVLAQTLLTSLFGRQVRRCQRIFREQLLSPSGQSLEKKIRVLDPQSDFYREHKSGIRFACDELHRMRNAPQ